MKAVVQDVYGSADVLRVEEIDRPSPGEGEVLVRVRAAGVDPGVWHLMTGLPYAARLALGLSRPRTRVRGYDLAGVVEAGGAGATRFRPGDEVFGVANGTFAEYACAREVKLAPRPANASFEEAAALPVSGCTALQALRDVGEVRPGQAVLVVGAGGSVGTLAVQIARALGARVTGVCSAAKTDLVRSLGAEDVVDYAREDFTAGGRRWDVVVDTAGSRPLARLRRVLAPRGTLVLVGGEGGGRWLGPLDRALRAAALRPFARQRLRQLFAVSRQADLEALRALVEAGKLRPVVDPIRGLAGVADALRRIEAGHATGKQVVTI